MSREERVNVNGEYVRADFSTYGRVDPDVVRTMDHDVFVSSHHPDGDSLNFVLSFLFLSELAFPPWPPFSPL